jgi:RNA polymerase primary sigma factor
VAEELGMSEDDVANSLKIGTNHASLDAPLTDGTSGSLMDLMHDQKHEKADDLAVRMSQNRVVNKLFSVLTDREREVVRLYYGIDEDANYTLTEIGTRMNITRERVRQIKDIALKKLKRSKKIKELRSSMA